MNQDLMNMLIPLLGTVLGYVGRMFTTEQMLKARLDRLEKDVDAAHKKLRGENAGS